MVFDRRPELTYYLVSKGHAPHTRSIYAFQSAEPPSFKDSLALDGLLLRLHLAEAKPLSLMSLWADPIRPGAWGVVPIQHANPPQPCATNPRLLLTSASSKPGPCPGLPRTFDLHSCLRCLRCLLRLYGRLLVSWVCGHEQRNTGSGSIHGQYVREAHSDVCISS